MIEQIAGACFTFSIHFSKEWGILCRITKIVQADAKRNLCFFSSDPT